MQSSSMPCQRPQKTRTKTRSIYSQPNVGIKLQNKPALSKSSPGRTIRPPRKERRYPPCSFLNSAFGKMYAADPDFERTEETAYERDYVPDREIAGDRGYRYGSRFRGEQPEEGEILIAFCSPENNHGTPSVVSSESPTSQCSSSVAEITKSEWIAPCSLSERSAPESSGLQKEIIGNRMDEFFVGKYGMTGRRRSWIHTDDEVSQMNAVLDLLYAVRVC